MRQLATESQLGLALGKSYLRDFEVVGQGSKHALLWVSDLLKLKGDELKGAKVRSFQTATKP